MSAAKNLREQSVTVDKTDAKSVVIRIGPVAVRTTVYDEAGNVVRTLYEGEVIELHAAGTKLLYDYRRTKKALEEANAELNRLRATEKSSRMYLDMLDEYGKQSFLRKTSVKKIETESACFGAPTDTTPQVIGQPRFKTPTITRPDPRSDPSSPEYDPLAVIKERKT